MHVYTQVTSPSCPSVYLKPYIAHAGPVGGCQRRSTASHSGRIAAVGRCCRCRPVACCCTISGMGSAAVPALFRGVSHDARAPTRTTTSANIGTPTQSPLAPASGESWRRQSSSDHHPRTAHFFARVMIVDSFSHALASRKCGGEVVGCRSTFPQPAAGSSAVALTAVDVPRIDARVPERRGSAYRPPPARLARNWLCRVLPRVSL